MDSEIFAVKPGERDKLFDLIDIQRNDQTEGPARSFKDYTVTIGKAPEGVEIIEKL